MRYIVEKIKPEKDYTFFYKYEHYNNFIFMKLIYYTKMNDHEKITSIDKNFTLKGFSRSYQNMALLYHYIYLYAWNNDIKYFTNYMKLGKKINSTFFTKKYFFEYFN